MTNVDIGKLYGVCRRFMDVWSDRHAEPAAFGPVVEELRDVLGTQQVAHRYEDLRYNLSLRAFTAPDAPDEEMLESLDARIRDAVSANGTPPSGDVGGAGGAGDAQAISRADGDAGQLARVRPDPRRRWPTPHPTTARHTQGVHSVP